VNHDLLAVDVDSDLPHVLGSAPRCVANSRDARDKRLQSDLPLAGAGVVCQGGMDMLGIVVGVEAPPNMGCADVAVAKLGVDMLGVIVGVETPPNLGRGNDVPNLGVDAAPDFGVVPKAVLAPIHAHLYQMLVG